MNTHAFTFAGASLAAMPSGALWWPGAGLLVVSDLHLGKSERIARRSGAMLPPYEVDETLSRLEADLAATKAEAVICLGDSFDDDAAARDLPQKHQEWIARLQAGRRWIWIAGNHDPAPLSLAGSHLGVYHRPPLSFRHIAGTASDDIGEVSGHYHPKCSVQLRGGMRVSRPCFVLDARRLIMPAYGAYTGGLRCDTEPLQSLMGADAKVILTGQSPVALPMPRAPLGDREAIRHPAANREGMR